MLGVEDLSPAQVFARVRCAGALRKQSCSLARKNRVYRLAFGLCLVLALLVSAMPTARAMQPLDEDELGQAVAQDGISLGIEMRFNTGPDGEPIPSSAGGQCSGFFLGGSVSNSECRLGISFANNPDDWLLLRGVYGMIDIEEINLDAGILHQASSSTSFFDPTRFQDPAGACLLPGGVCNANTLRNNPALAFEFPTTSPSYSPVSGVSSGYDSVRFGFGVEEALVVFGVDAFTSTAPGTFLRVRAQDNNGYLGGMAIRGQTYVYGF